jgi:hypothetical protein
VVAFYDPVYVFILYDRTDGTHHNTGPAAHAFGRINDDIARFLILSDAACNTGLGA